MEQVTAKSILSAGYAKNNSWFGCNYNMNLYRGCCHGCIYCDSRSDCYHIERIRVCFPTRKGASFLFPRGV